jgi:hypothetical protein
MLYCWKSLLNQLAELACCYNPASGELSLGMIYGIGSVCKCERRDGLSGLDGPMAPSQVLDGRLAGMEMISGHANVCYRKSFDSF